MQESAEASINLESSSADGQQVEAAVSKEQGAIPHQSRVVPGDKNAETSLVPECLDDLQCT